MTMTITNLPVDLVEEILSRVLVKSIGAVRSTCKNWNVISKDEGFANKHIGKAAAAAAREKEYFMITAGDSMDCLVSFNFFETSNKNSDLSINRTTISITREDSDEAVFISGQAFLSNGLLICVWEDSVSNIRYRLLVWNPYWGKIRWIECPAPFSYAKFAFGYDKSCGSHKILRFSNHINLDIYDLSSDSWRTLNVSINKHTIYQIETGLSLKGNTYWCVSDYEDNVLDSFDFTRERFGPGLPLPVPVTSHSTVCLSSIKEEKLAVLVSPLYTFEADIWITNKIDPYTVSWSKFLKVETTRDIDNYFWYGSHFFIDEEKKVIVVFCTYDRSYYISGESGHFRKMFPREPSYRRPYRLVGCYVPSSVQI